ncbi:hypothetical protein CA13_44340 [Planctomycetes bacterium CA13]|uniref:Uncharacterized protein n=1 Tax=Novipirellula herctigrandis TaxID=2527986 RepID=A0A5C5Z809_9BACT|nr:hypothetical protein CA13_44340 [Planctomycetes bacterium CA13]
MSLPNLSPNNLGLDSDSFAVSSGTPASQNPTAKSFVDRRKSEYQSRGERRQFGSSYAELSADGCELALAIDQYKVEHHRRYITCDEMLKVMHSLGYSR